MFSTKLVPLSFDIYELSRGKKDLGLSVDISDFDKSKLSLTPCNVNPNNYNVLYDGKKYRLFVKVMNGKLKRSVCLEDEIYLSVKDDCISNRLKLNEMFSTVKAKLNDELSQEKKDIVSFEWNKIWMICSDYDLTEKHVYHFENVYLAIDEIILLEDPWLPIYKLNCVMIGGSVVMCRNCDTFLL